MQKTSLSHEARRLPFTVAKGAPTRKRYEMPYGNESNRLVIPREQMEFLGVAITPTAPRGPRKDS